MIKLKTLIFESISPSEAEQIFSRYGVPNVSKLSKDELKKSWRELSKTFHPDKNPSKKDEMNLAMQWINSAYSVLSNSPQKSSSEKSYDDYYSNNVYQQDRQQSNRRTSDTHYAGWAQAGRSGGLPNNDYIYNQNFQDLNYCKKTAWEISGKPPCDRNHEYSFSIWDGSHFRGGFSVYAVPEKLFEISQIVSKWETHHRTVAVFCHRKIDHVALLVNLRGQEVKPPKEIEDFEPNDQQFRDYLRKSL
jgi:curved DNA-binding protein CbpA